MLSTGERVAADTPALPEAEARLPARPRPGPAVTARQRQQRLVPSAPKAAKGCCWLSSADQNRAPLRQSSPVASLVRVSSRLVAAVAASAEWTTQAAHELNSTQTMALVVLRGVDAVLSMCTLTVRQCFNRLF